MDKETFYGINSNATPCNIEFGHSGEGQQMPGHEVVDFNEKKYDRKIIYPEGTVLWTMRGIRQNKNITWRAVPYSIEKYIKKPTKHYTTSCEITISPSSIGKNYFLTRQEAIDKFLMTHDSLIMEVPVDVPLEELLSEEDREKVKEKERTDFQDIVIYEFDSVDSATVYLGGFSDLKKINDELDWHIDKEISEVLGVKEYKYLSLKEVFEQVKIKYGKTVNVFGKPKLSVPIITVIIDEPFKGTIYNCNNHEEGIWEKVGETKGYA